MAVNNGIDSSKSDKSEYTTAAPVAQIDLTRTPRVASVEDKSSAKQDSNKRALVSESGKPAQIVVIFKEKDSANNEYVWQYSHEGEVPFEYKVFKPGSAGNQSL